MKEDSGFANRFVSTLPGADESTKSGSGSGRAAAALMVAASALPPASRLSQATVRAAWLTAASRPSSIRASRTLELHVRATWALTKDPPSEGWSSYSRTSTAHGVSRPDDQPRPHSSPADHREARRRE